MDAAVTIAIDDKDFQAMMKRLGEVAVKHGKEILHSMALYYEKVITGPGGVFEKEGARSGQDRWHDYKTNTIINPKTGTWKIRYGTDLLPYGTPGVYVKNARRYSLSSKLLQAGGMFRASFRVHSATENSIKFGTEETLTDKRGSFKAADIIGDRPVLVITDGDREKMAGILLASIKKAIKP